MLKIFDQLWYVKSNNSNKATDLSYMTYYKDDAAFKKRKATGLSWASRSNPNEQGDVVDNELIAGFQVISSVSRWSTQNKLFRVRDPRGFVVEIPSGNLAKLIACTTITNGTIADKCIWGREGQDHLLIPEQSDLYQEACVNMTKLNKKISMKDIAVGEVIEVSANGRLTKRIYLGQCKSTHTGEAVSRSGSYWTSTSKVIASFDAYTETKWWYCFTDISTLDRIDNLENSYIGFHQMRTTNVTNRTGQKLDMDIVTQIRDCMKYGTSSAATAEFRTQLEQDGANNGTSVRINTTFVGAEWK